MTPGKTTVIRAMMPRGFRPNKSALGSSLFVRNASRIGTTSESSATKHDPKSLSTGPRKTGFLLLALMERENLDHLRAPWVSPVG